MLWLSYDSVCCDVCDADGCRLIDGGVQNRIKYNLKGELSEI